MKSVPWILFILVLAMLAVHPREARAVARCDQANVGWCIGGDNCSKSIEFTGSCAAGTRKWRCRWQGTPSCNEVGDWEPCNCDENTPHCDCLVGGTPISMADGTTKSVQDIKAGDQVLAYDQVTQSMTTSTVLKVHAPYNAHYYYVINERISVTQNHPILSRGKWVPAGELQIGGVFATPGEPATPIFSIRRVDEDVMVFNFQVAAGTYVANGVIVHNKEDCEIYQQVCIGDCGGD